MSVVKRAIVRVVPSRIISAGAKTPSIGQPASNVSRATTRPKLYVAKNVQLPSNIEGASVSYQKTDVKTNSSQKAVDFVVVKAATINKIPHHNPHHQEVDLVTNLNRAKAVVL